jgi:hypothetical protein
LVLPAESHLQPLRSKRGALVLELRKQKDEARSQNAEVQTLRAQNRELLLRFFSLLSSFEMNWCSDRDSHPDLTV